VTTAIALASAVLEQWSEIPSKIRVRISYANQLTDTSNNPAALEQVHISDLRKIEGFWTDVEVDTAWWLERTNEYNAREIDLRLDGKIDEAAALVKPPALGSGSISLRLGDGRVTAMSLEVHGPDRTNVEGLTSRLVDVLNRSASGPTNISNVWCVSLIPVAVALGTFIGWKVVRGFNLAPLDNRWEWQEIVIPVAAALVMTGLLAGVAWVFPTLELLDSGERSRFQRNRAWLFSAICAVIFGVIGTAIWAAFT